VAHGTEAQHPRVKTNDRDGTSDAPVVCSYNGTFAACRKVFGVQFRCTCSLSTKKSYVYKQMHMNSFFFFRFARDLAASWN